MPHGKQTIFEEDIRAPFLLRGPGVVAGLTVQPLVGNYDLAPTFLDIAGAAPVVPVDGRSVLGLAAGGGRAAWNRSYTLQEGFYGCYPSIEQGDTCEAPGAGRLTRARAARPGACTLEPGVNYKSHNIGDPRPAADAGACCSLCEAEPACVLFSFNPRTARSMCLLKSQQGGRAASPGTVSGRTAASPPPPPPGNRTSAWSYRGLRLLDGAADLTYTEWCDGETELYNNTADPFQLRNVAGALAGSPLLQTLAAVLASVATCKGDTCPGRGAVPLPDPRHTRQPCKCEWPTP